MDDIDGSIDGAIREGRDAGGLTGGDPGFVADLDEDQQEWARMIVNDPQPQDPHYGLLVKYDMIRAGKGAGSSHYKAHVLQLVDEADQLPAD